MAGGIDHLLITDSVTAGPFPEEWTGPQGLVLDYMQIAQEATVVTTKGQEALNTVLKLDPQERASIAAQLLASLEDEAEELEPGEWDRIWSAEIERRVEEIDSGKVKSISGDVVRDRVRTIIQDAKLV